MSDVIDELLSRGDDIATSGPSSRADINAAARQFDGPLPEALTKLWRETDGVRIDPLDADLLGPAQVLQLLADTESWGEAMVDCGWVPVLDDHQSNYLAVCVRGPLAFRVLHVPHDDGPRVLYRNFESCVQALLGAADAGETADLFLFDTEGDYPPDTPRTEEDQDAARALLAGPDEHAAWNHAVRLLDASDLEEWARLLETDHFVRRDVLARMRKMRSPAIQELLRKDGEAFDAFATTFADILRRAGLPVGERNDRNVRVGKAWYNLEAFFHRRDIPNAMPRMVAWIEDQLAGRDPRTRPGNFMAD